MYEIHEQQVDEMKREMSLKLVKEREKQERFIHSLE